MGEELVEVKNKIIETSEEITPVVQFKEWVVDSDLPHIPFRQLVNKALQDVNLASVISKIEKGTEYVVKVPLEFKKAYDEGKVFVAQNSETGILRPILAKYNDKGKLEVNVAVNHVFLSWVFGFSGKVKIKGPENVLEEYKDMVQKVFASLQ